MIHGAGGILCLMGFLVFGYQVMTFLKTGLWIEMPLMIVFSYLPSDLSHTFQWLYEPYDWYGLHKLTVGILNYIPLALFLIIAGCFMFDIGFIKMEDHGNTPVDSEE